MTTSSTPISSALSAAVVFYYHFSFIVEHCQAEDLLEAIDSLKTRLRFNQMRAVSVAPDLLDKQRGFEAFPCQLEGRRIAASGVEATVQGEQRKLSLSVHTRLRHGQTRRQNHYLQLGAVSDDGVLADYGFTDDLQSLAQCQGYGSLENKIAVLYMDGNQFGSILKKKLTQASGGERGQIEARRAFDRDVQGRRDDFMRDVLREMTRELGSRFPNAVIDGDANNAKTLRFETLLWGGDEMLLVVPAWYGFELLQYFFSCAKDWRSGDVALTHAAGLVFCGVGAPIRVIRQLAKSLADTIKHKLGEARSVNRWDYLVLESIDYPTSDDIDDFHRGRYGAELAGQRRGYFAPDADWERSKIAIAALKLGELMARRQLYRIAAAIQRDRAANEPERAAEAEAEAEASWQQIVELEELKNPSAQVQAEQRLFALQDKGGRERLAGLLRQLAADLFQLDIETAGSRAWLWLNLLELWDYLPPVRREP